MDCLHLDQREAFNPEENESILYCGDCSGILSVVSEEPDYFDDDERQEEDYVAVLN